jgi:hypothetical protein
MVPVAFLRTEGSDEPIELGLVRDDEAKCEMRASERGEQLKACLEELAGGRKVHGAIRPEPAEESLQRCRPDVVEGTETETPHTGWPSSTKASWVR